MPKATFFICQRLNSIKTVKGFLLPAEKENPEEVQIIIIYSWEISLLQ